MFNSLSSTILFIVTITSSVLSLLAFSFLFLLSLRQRMVRTIPIPVRRRLSRVTSPLRYPYRS
jgi:hypothetical protein